MKPQVKTLNQVSHIESQRRAFESNQHFIRAELGLTILEYQETILEMGCKFLEVRYGLDTLHYQKFAYSKSFWDWFTLEWKVFEREYISFLKQHNVDFTRKDWISEVQQIVMDNNVDNAYHHTFLKLNRNASKFRI